MKDANDKTTVDFFAQKRSRGRPVTGQAKSDAERARAYRKRKKQLQSSSQSEELRASLLLAQFLSELGDYATVMPSEKWVSDVRAYFDLK
jgi:hypothetical protein